MPHNGSKVQSNRDNDNYYDTGCPYLNLLKSATLWTQNDGTYSGWPIGEIDRLDDRGYIKDFSNPKHGCTGWGCLFPVYGDARASKTYVLRGKGSGTITVGNSSNVVVPGTHRKGDHWEFSFPAGTYYAALYLPSARNLPNRSDYIRDLVLLHEEDVAAYDAGQVFGTRELELRRAFGMLRFLDQMSNFRQAAKIRDAVPYDYYTWVTFVKPGRYCGIATREDKHGLRYRVGAPADGFSTDNHMEQCWVGFEPGDAPPFIPEAKTESTTDVMRGTTTRLRLAGPLHAAFAPGEWVWVVQSGGNWWAPATLVAGMKRAGSGFQILSIDVSDPSHPIIELDVDTSADDDCNSNSLRVMLRQFLKIGSNDYVPLGDWAAGNYYSAREGNSFIRNNACIFYDKLMNLYIAYNGGEDSAGGRYSIPPPQMMVEMCNKIGAHLWLPTPYLAGDSGDKIPNPNNWPDLFYELGKYVKEHLDDGLYCVYEPCNEQWNALFHGYQYSIPKMRFRGSVGNQANQWYGMSLSALGQRIAAAYNTPKAQVRLQKKYRVACGFQYVVLNYAGERLGGDGWWKGNAWHIDEAGMDPAYEWTTDTTVANYFNSPLYKSVPIKPDPFPEPTNPQDGDLWSAPDGRYLIWSPRAWGRGGWVEIPDDVTRLGNGGEWQMAKLYKDDPATYVYLLDEFVASTKPENVEEWDAKKTYTPRPDGRTPYVSYNGRAYLCAKESTGRAPHEGSEYWVRPHYGMTGSVQEVVRAYTTQPKYNPPGLPLLGCLCYEGGWSPDFYGYWQKFNMVDDFREATMMSDVLRVVTLLNYQACKDHDFEFPSEFVLEGNSPWSVWFGSQFPGQYWGAVDPHSGLQRPQLPPRFQAALEWNAGAVPPRPSRPLAGLPRQPPKLQVEPPKGQAEQHAAPGWCLTLHHPNANLCGTVHEPELPKRSVLPKLEDIRPRRRQ